MFARAFEWMALIAAMVVAQPGLPAFAEASGPDQFCYHGEIESASDAGRHIEIDAVFNDKRIAAIFDTGAGKSSVVGDAGGGSALVANLSSRVVVKFPYGDHAAREADLIAGHIGDCALPETGAFLLDPVSPNDKVIASIQKIQGTGLLLGQPAIRQFDWVLDYKHGKVSARKPAPKRPENERLGSFKIGMEVLAERLVCTVDTGNMASQYLYLTENHPLAARFAQSDLPRQKAPSHISGSGQVTLYFDPDGTVYGLNGNGLLISVEKGGDRSGEDGDGCLAGAQLFAESVLYLDSAEDFVRTSGALIAATYNRSGLMAGRYRPDLEGLEILRQKSESALDRSGIRSGDIVTRIDGATLSVIGLDGVRAKLSQPKGTRVAADVLRDGRAMRFDIVLDAPLGD